MTEALPQETVPTEPAPDDGARQPIGPAQPSAGWSARKRALLVLILSLLGGLAAVLKVTSEKRQYESVLTLFVSPIAQGGLQQGYREAAGFSLLGGLTQSMRDFEVAVLQSNQLRLGVAAECKLAERDDFWGPSLPASKRNQQRLLLTMERTCQVKAKDSLIKLTVHAGSPELSKQIADAHLKLLHARFASDDGTRRTMLEQQVRKARETLAASEEALRRFMRSRPLPPGEDTERAEISSLIELHKQLVLAEAELSGTISQMAAPGDLHRQIELKSQEANLGGRLEVLRAKIKSREAQLRLLPDALLEYQRLLRAIKINEQVYALLNEQLSSALYQEVGKLVPFKVVDEPRIADEPVSRMGLLKVLLGTFLGMALGLALTNLFAGEPQEDVA